MHTFCEWDPPPPGVKLHFMPVFGHFWHSCIKASLDPPFINFVIHTLNFVFICSQKNEVARGLKHACHVLKRDKALRITSDEAHALLHHLITKRTKRRSCSFPSSYTTCSFDLQPVKMCPRLTLQELVRSRIRTSCGRKGVPLYVGSDETDVQPFCTPLRLQPSGQKDLHLILAPGETRLRC